MTKYAKIAEKLLTIEQLPEGALSRYQRDIYRFAKANGYEKTFEEYLEDERKKSEEYAIKHPLLYYKRVRIDTYESIEISKTKGHDWFCYHSDGTPNYSAGGDYKISLKKALRLINDPQITAEVKAIKE